MEFISALNHASRASGRCRRRSARTLLIYLEIIDDPAEAAEAEDKKPWQAKKTQSIPKNGI